MYGTCNRCKGRRHIGHLVWITDGWGGRRIELCCLSCKRPAETYDSASD